jgi:hypothetical protein
MTNIIAKYRLKKDLPDLKAGVIFEHREYDPKYPDRGNIGWRVLILGWINGMCQGSWAGETYIFPGQLVNNTEWFEKIENNSKKESLLQIIDEFRKKIEKLDL